MQLKITLERFSEETKSVLYDDFFLEDQVIVFSYVKLRLPYRIIKIHRSICKVTYFFIRSLVTRIDKISGPKTS